ncbi:PDZ domain-containing protein, partial [Oleiphilus sp. HI0086]
MGVSFAIPIDVAMEVVAQLKGQGYVARGWLGVLIQEVNKDLADSFGLDRPYGALVAQVVEDSPADQAGIQTGDVIIEYEGEEIDFSSELPQLVGRTKVGDKAKLKVVRDGDEKSVSVEIGELPTDESASALQNKPQVEKTNRIGIKVRELDHETLDDLNLDGGVHVIQVESGAAREAGIKQGDIITRLNNQKFTSVKEFQKVVESLPSDRAVPALIVRQGSPSFIVI